MNRPLLILIAIALLLGLGAYWLAEPAVNNTQVRTTTSVAEAMGSSDTTGYDRADRVIDFSFPADHGPHPGFQTEWWYFTGNLDGDDGAAYGFKFTIFRSALSPPDSATVTTVSSDPATASDWRTNQFYMSHVGVSAMDRAWHRSAERFARGGAGLAGARAQPFRVWLDDWEMQSAEPVEQTPDATPNDATFPLRLQMSDEDMGFDLTVTPQKPPVFQGDRGLSQKGPGTGNASYYYSYTRLDTEGQIMVEGDTIAVTGQSWMDREWSTSALAEDQEGWDWFSLQFDDGRELMYYQLRQDDGTPSSFSKGLLVDTDGSSTLIERSDVELEVTDTWTSDLDGESTYPVAWQMRIPEYDLDLTIESYFPGQEMDVSVRYWEGAVQINGTAGASDLSGRGYVELTGYADGASAGPMS